ncbi:MAG: YceI family protein [Lysobacteraceae bacterium]
MKIGSGVVALALCVLTAGQPLHASEWVSDARRSTLAFVGVYQGDAFNGRFGQFIARITFDPARLAASRFDVQITLASADTANSERDAMLKGAEFFDATRIPIARYTSTRFRSLGDNRYLAEGVLSLRGISKPVPLQFSWTPSAMPTLTGDATINRLDFDIGGGQWKDTGVIGTQVKVHAALKLLPRNSAPAH